MTTLILSDLTDTERLQFEQRPKRLTMHELFRIGPTGLEEISDATLDLRLDARERKALADGTMTLSQMEPMEAV